MARGACRRERAGALVGARRIPGFGRARPNAADDANESARDGHDTLQRIVGLDPIHRSLRELHLPDLLCQREE
jgi:hypothetical protein